MEGCLYSSSVSRSIQTYLGSMATVGTLSDFSRKKKSGGKGERVMVPPPSLVPETFAPIVPLDYTLIGKKLILKFIFCSQNNPHP